MARQTPTDLADEILARGGRWSLSGARFRPPEDRETGVSVALGGREFWSDIALDRPASRARTHDAATLKRAGYEILAIRSKPFHARRPLRGLRELDAEVQRLTALSRDRSGLASFPARLPRRPGLPAGDARFSTAAFDRLRYTHGWTPEYVSVCRRGAGTVIGAPGWSTVAWCLFLVDGDERWIYFHVQLYRKQSDKIARAEFAKLKRTLRGRIAPLGYDAVTLRGLKKPALFAVFHKRVGTLSAARHGRTRLDRVLFGD
jgi:hypothetical protein